MASRRRRRRRRRWWRRSPGSRCATSSSRVYVERALGEPGDSLGSDVLSQLFDQFLDERLLTLLAVDRGLLPAGRRRGAAAGAAPSTSSSPPPPAGRRRPGEPTEAELRAWYDAHRERFAAPGSASACASSWSRTADEADQALAEIRAGASFAAVARRLADDPEVAATGGALGELSRDDVPPAFADVIFALAPGEVSEVVEADYGFHLFQVTETLPAQVLPLAAVRDEVAAALREDAADRRLHELVDEARRRYDVSVWERNLPFNYRGIYLAEAG